MREERVVQGIWKKAIAIIQVKREATLAEGGSSEGPDGVLL